MSLNERFISIKVRYKTSSKKGFLIKKLVIYIDASL